MFIVTSSCSLSCFLLVVGIPVIMAQSGLCQELFRYSNVSY